MKISACGNSDSPYHPTLDHICPRLQGGQDIEGNIEGNIEICHRDTNAEKADSFPIWTTNEKRFQAKRVKGKSGEYKIIGRD